MPVTRNDLQKGFKALKVKAPVIVHASLSSFGQVEGGAETVVEALLAVFSSVMAPTFTYKTMVTPLVGPPNNGLTYGSGLDANRMAEFFTPDMPADSLMGIIAETLRRHPHAERSTHPILSFSGVNVSSALRTQTLREPLAPIGALVAQGGWVLLLGVDHTVNTSIHYAERLANRKTFIRWALTPQGVVECPNFPGCSAGFQAIASHVEKVSRRVRVGNAIVQAIPLKVLIERTTACLWENPLALLCAQDGCERCAQTRATATMLTEPPPRSNI